MSVPLELSQKLKGAYQNLVLALMGQAKSYLPQIRNL